MKKSKLQASVLNLKKHRIVTLNAYGRGIEWLEKLMSKQGPCPTMVAGCKSLQCPPNTQETECGSACATVCVAANGIGCTGAGW